MEHIIAETMSYYEIASRLPADTVVIWHGVSWEDYEELLVQVGEAPGLRISYNDRALKVITISSEHEKYTRFIEALVGAVRLRLRMKIISFGSATMKNSKAIHSPLAA